jgi:hypothetical protein
MLEVQFTTTEIDEDKNELLLETRQTRSCSAVEFFFVHLRRYFFGILPPLWYFNQFTQLDSLDGRFEGRRVLFQWKFRQLSAAEYASIGAFVLRWPGVPYERVEVPENLKTKPEYEDWAFLYALERQHREARR